MNVTSYEWATRLAFEANKCWVYAIGFSILVSLYQLLLRNTTPQPTTSTEKSTIGNANEKASPATGNEKPAKPAKQPKTNIEPATTIQYSEIFRQLVIDSCDLVIAGSSVGWIPADEIQVGTAYIISSTIAGQKIWSRLQSHASVEAETDFP